MTHQEVMDSMEELLKEEIDSIYDELIAKGIPARLSEGVIRIFWNDLDVNKLQLPPELRQLVRRES